MSIVFYSFQTFELLLPVLVGLLPNTVLTSLPFRRSGS